MYREAVNVELEVIIGNLLGSVQMPLPGELISLYMYIECDNTLNINCMLLSFGHSQQLSNILCRVR